MLSDQNQSYASVLSDPSLSVFSKVLWHSSTLSRYTRSAIGMPGSTTVLEEMMGHVFGDLIQKGCVTKLADELYCGGDSPETLLFLISNHKSIVLPCLSDTLWIVTDGSVTKRGLGATLYISHVSHLHLAGFYRGKLRKNQVTWLPCEVEALSIAAAVKYFSPFIIQSLHPTPALTDSKPSIQAIDKLCRRDFSASPPVTSFLTTVSRYLVILQYLAGKANLPSDFTSHNAPDCNKPNCQICTFVHYTEDSVVRDVSLQDILDNKSSLPFSTRSAGLQIQNDFLDLRRGHAHLKQGTCLSKKLTNIRDVKRYLNCRSTTEEPPGVFMVKRSQPFVPVIEAIVVPQSMLDGLNIHAWKMPHSKETSDVHLIIIKLRKK